MDAKTKLKIKIGVPCFLVGVAISIYGGAGFIWSYFDDPLEFIRFLSDYRTVKNNYYKTASDHELFQGATKGMVASLGDPYSSVLFGKDYDSFMEQVNGEYGGIGVVISQGEDGKPVLLNVFPTGSAAQAGLMVGDILTAIDEKSTEDLGLDGTASAVRGENGSTVEIDINRNGESLHFTVERSEITLPTVQSYMASPDIGYIHIYSFGSHTADEFKDQLDSLKTSGAKKLIIDVRMNPGGLIDSVVAVANQILTKGTVVSYHTKNGKDEDFNINGIEHPMPIAILIDKNSASASEILAGAVQDKKEGTIIGENSFGKGTVQAVLSDNNHNALRISIAQYMTPSGKTIDKVGIQPDISIKQTGFLFIKDKDNVIQKAVDVLSAQ